MTAQENVLSDKVNIRYVAETRRDLRIDMLRGIALVMMVVAHTEVLSILNVVTWERFGLTTGAEGFVILSGFMIGYLKRRQLQTEPMLTVAYSLLRRAVTLYIVNVVFIVSILILSQLRFIDTFEVTHFTDRFSDTSYSMFPVNEQVREAWFNEVIFLQIGPHQTQILGLYFYLLLISPVILWLLNEKKGRGLLLLSVAAYIFYQFSRVRVTSAEFEFAFPLLAWQLIFVMGMCCGWYKEEIFSLSKTQAGKGILTGMVTFALVMMFVAQNHTNPFLPPKIMMHFIVPANFNWFYQTFAAKNELGPLRIANDFCLIITMYLLLTRYWMPINRLLGWFLIVLGQNSLYVFIVHVYVILFTTQFVTFNLWEKRWVFNTFVHLSVLMVLWLMARYGVMRKIIPN
ncbi:OpgC domain-containing protein [Serratia fonticola]|uniref:OpgC domain-containing protein n=1 Tax=Serratia fonticola TaxID=47917 RepID=A0ABY9PGX2_SERFO|nr:OpgC domain-containing protein [Serratia fonticola]WMT12670.1 OpgC domain-containing protein [Serratia fonticola]